MSPKSKDQNSHLLHGCYVLSAAMVFVLAGAALISVWLAPRLIAQFPAPSSTAVSPATTLLSLTPTPSIHHLTFTDLGAVVDDQAQAITFRMAASAPPDRQISKVVLWYATETGYQLQPSRGPFTNRTAISYRLEPASEALTTSQTTRQLDYWWWVRDSSGESIRAGGTVIVGSGLQIKVVNATQESLPLDFAWAVSESAHLEFHYAPDSAASRDLPRLGALAEAALAQTTEVLETEFEGQMDIYLVPRIFWQGGATYNDRVQLISYLDRNYTAVETWSYFTHEGTHALAQDLRQPSRKGGPDGILVEGLAVWATGGHYRREPLDAWAAITAASDDYIPLADLRAGPFYTFQHEKAYIEAASFVKYLIEQYGLDTFKELYSLATGDAAHDGALVKGLYGRSYSELEAEWLSHLVDLSPTPEQSLTWQLEVRSFDLMRRYETEMDPDARLLPPKPPTEWTSDTLQAFLHRADEPTNVVLETALIAGQDRLHSGDLDGAAALMDDVEAALDTGSDLSRPSLRARQAILDLLTSQDRAILHADANGYRATVDQAQAVPTLHEERLLPPFVAYHQEVVRLDIADDGHRAWGVVLLHAELADGYHPENGRLFAITFSKTPGRWLMSSRRSLESYLPLPPATGD